MNPPTEATPEARRGGRPQIAIRLIAMLALLAGCGGSESEREGEGREGDAPTRRTVIRFQTDWYPQPEHGGFYQALANGYYADAGLDVVLLPGGPGSRTAQKLVAGAADVGMHRSDDIITLAAEGLPFLMIGAFMQHDPQALLLHASNPIDSFAELDGETIMAMPGTSWIRYLKARYQIEFQLVPMTYSLARFLADQDFIQQCFITNEPYFARQHGAEPKTMLIAHSGYDPYRVIFTTRRFARDHPGALRAFVAASLRGWEDFIGHDPAPAKRQIAASNEHMTEAFMDFSIGEMRRHRLVRGDPDRGERLGLMTRQRLKAQRDTLLHLGILNEFLPIEAFASFDFLPPDLAARSDGSGAEEPDSR